MFINILSHENSMKKAMIPLAIAGAAYLANPASAYSQTQQDTGAERNNRIYSRLDHTTAGEGVALKKVIYDVILNPNENINLGNLFGFTAKRGEVSYTLIGGKEGLEQITGFIKKDGSLIRSQAKPMFFGYTIESDTSLTDKEQASLNYFTTLLSFTKPSDPAAVNLLERAVKDGVIKAKEDGLLVDGQWKIPKEGGLYTLIVRSEDVGQFKGNSIPVLMHITPSSATLYVPQDTLEGKTGKALEPTTDTTGIEADTLKAPWQRDSDADRARQEGRAKPTYAIDRHTGRIAKTKKDLSPSFGLEASVGTNGEIPIGAFFRAPLNSYLALELSSNYHARKGDLGSDSTTDVVERELVNGGAGIYQERIDELTTILDKKTRAEFTAGPVLTFGPVDVALRAGASVLDELKTYNAKSKIRHIRNGNTLDENVIEGTQSFGSELKAKYLVGADVILNLTKDIALKGQVVRTGDQNSFRGGVRVIF
jgi:hypothetical protein